jgi:hypothetical protein
VDRRATGAANFAFLAQDAAAARFRARAESTPACRLLAWQGGWVALAAAYDTTAAFVVLVSAPSFALDQTMFQRTNSPRRRSTRGPRRDRAAEAADWDYWLSPPARHGRRSPTTPSAERPTPWSPTRWSPAISQSLTRRRMGSNGTRRDGGPDTCHLWSLRHEPVSVWYACGAAPGHLRHQIAWSGRRSVVNFQAALGRAYNRRGSSDVSQRRPRDKRGGARPPRRSNPPGYRDTVMAWLDGSLGVFQVDRPDLTFRSSGLLP